MELISLVKAIRYILTLSILLGISNTAFTQQQCQSGSESDSELLLDIGQTTIRQVISDLSGDSMSEVIFLRLTHENETWLGGIADVFNKQEVCQIDTDLIPTIDSPQDNEMIAPYFLFERGDLDGDGVKDFLLGAMLSVNGSGSEVQIADISGRNCEFIGDPGITLPSIAFAHADINADGVKDFVANFGGYPDNRYDVISGATLERIFTFYAPIGTRNIDGATATDLTGDGIPDFTFFRFLGNPVNDIQILIYDGSPQGIPDRLVATVSIESILPYNDRNNINISRLPDLNGDSVAELAVQNKQFDAYGQVTDEIYLFLNGSQLASDSLHVLYTISKPVGRNLHGLTAINDINGDDVPELLVDGHFLIVLLISFQVPVENTLQM